MSKDTGGPAFPALTSDCNDWRSGMTLRDYFASDAMKSILSRNNLESDDHAEIVAKVSYVMADFMIAERAK